MNDIDKLTEYFREFPGIGPRQAKRFVYFLLRKNEQYVRELATLIPQVRRNVSVCQDCFKYFTKNNNLNVCDICFQSRDHSQLMVVARDTDLEAIEKSDGFHGYYFVLGGQLPILESEAQKFIRFKELIALIEKKKEKGLAEIILALSANPDGDNTANFLRNELASYNLKISTLGRGLSTGSELEYADKDTIKNALENRK
ncbi:MAG: toprim domain-containing protein [Candidatus Paceibacterota bacterium]